MNRIKIFIIDDTITYRKILTEAISQYIPEAEVSGTAVNGSTGIQKLKFNPTDLVLLDIAMPGMNGLETLIEINKQFPKISVVMISGVTTHDAEITLRALEEGALEFIPKKVNSKSPTDGLKDIAEEVKKVIKLLQERNNLTQPPIQRLTTSTSIAQRALDASVRKFPPVSKNLNFSLLVIGCSTGGPKALYDIIPQINPNIGCPILIVQHMPPPFTKKLAEHLDSKSDLTIKEATLSGEQILPNTIYIAPAGSHMIIKSSPLDKKILRIFINQDPHVHSCRPSIDVLFKSIATNVESPIVSVILTGMGYDGAAGVELMKKAIPCYSIAQDKASSVVYGMPKVIVERNLADEVLPLEKIPEMINMLFKRQHLSSTRIPVIS